MIHIHRWSKWAVIKARVSDDEGNVWHEDTQQRQCTVCGLLKVRRL